MECLSREILCAYTEGDLSAAQRQEVEKHLATCQRCRAELALQVQMEQALTGEPTLEPSPALVEKVMASAGLRPALWARSWKYVAWAAALLVVAISVSVWIGWGDHVAQMTQRAGSAVQSRIEAPVVSLEVRLDNAVEELQGRTAQWVRWTTLAVVAACQAASHPLFWCTAVLLLLSFVLYQCLDFVWEERHWKRLQRATTDR